MAYKRAHVMSAMWWCSLSCCSCWKTNASPALLQFPHQQHFSLILPVDFSARFNANQVVITKFRISIPQQRPDEFKIY